MKIPNSHDKYKYVLKVVYSCKTCIQLEHCIAWINGLNFADNKSLCGRLEHFEMQSSLLKLCTTIYLNMEPWQ